MRNLKTVNGIMRYIAHAQPCLYQKNNIFYLLDKDDKPIIKFDKRISGKSTSGIVYLNTGTGLARLLKFSSKLTSSMDEGNKLETEILEKMTRLVLDGKCPNMPITYKTLLCDKVCVFKECPSVTKKGPYFVVFNELASYDLEHWLESSHDVAELESVFMQILLGIYSFHKLGYSHNDLHPGNFLVHEVKSGGYWRYKVDGVDIFVPNCGYQVVLWDPGYATPLYDFYIDYLSALDIIGKPKSFIESFINPVSKTLDNTKTKREQDLFSAIVECIRNHSSSIKIGGKAPGRLLNIKPYTL